MGHNLSFKFGTIFGANLGFEFIPSGDFQSINFPAHWSFMLNLLFVRFTLTRYKDD